MSSGSTSPVVAQRIRRWVLLTIAAGVIAYLGFGLSRWVAARHEYQAEFQRTRAAIRALEDTPPPGFEPGQWKTAVIWSHNAYLETFVYLDPADRDALDRFGSGLREGVGREPGPDLLEWIWDELERASPRGKRYVDRFRGNFREVLEAGR